MKTFREALQEDGQKSQGNEEFPERGPKTVRNTKEVL